MHPRLLRRGDELDPELGDRTRRRIDREYLRVLFVHPREVGRIGEQHRDLDDIFELQDQLAASVVGAHMRTPRDLDARERHRDTDLPRAEVDVDDIVTVDLEGNWIEGNVEPVDERFLQRIQRRYPRIASKVLLNL